MDTSLMDSLEIKKLFKQAIVEVLQERKDLFADVFVEAMEEVALAKAIEEGEATEPVSRDEIFQILSETA
jgi:dsDNA-specific endonuclease/ATPase MutS2